MPKKNEIRIQTGYGPQMSIEFVGGPKPYLWVGNDGNYGYVSDRSVRKLKRFCDTILKKAKRPRKADQ